MADQTSMTGTATRNGVVEPGYAAGVRPTAPSGDAPLGDLFRQLATDSASLLRQEVALAKAELQENVRTAVRNAAMAAVGGGLALVGALVMVLFLVLALGDALNEYWLGALIVGVLLLIIGGFMAMGSLRRLRGDALTPDRTIQNLKEDKQWAQNEIRQVRQDLT